MKQVSQFIITTENIPDFLLLVVQSKLKMRIEKILECEEVGRYSNNNYLWRVKVKIKHSPFPPEAGRRPNRRKGHNNEMVLFVKQARAYNKRAWETEREKHYGDPRRIRGEYRMIKLLSRLWGKEYVPEIYYFDPAQCVLVMSDVSAGGRLLVDEFLRGRVHAELGALVGGLLGKLHATTYRSKSDCCGSPAHRKKMISFFGLWWLGQGMAKFVPRRALNEFYREANRSPRAWIWGDPVHRNIFVKPGGKVSMVDFDHAVAYDPALDCGMLLAHWMWMGLKNAELGMQNEKFQKDFWKVYEREFVRRIFPSPGLRPPSPLGRGEGEGRWGDKEGLRGEVHHIQRRAMRWAGIYLVSRTDGRSGSYFKKWPRWEKQIRELGIALFNE